MTPYTVITLGELLPGVPVVQVHRVFAQPDESVADMQTRLKLSAVTHVFQGHPPFNDEPVPAPATIVVYMDGGLVQNVTSDRPGSAELIVIDADTDGADVSELTEVDGELVFIRSSWIEVDPEYVAKAEAALLAGHDPS